MSLGSKPGHPPGPLVEAATGPLPIEDDADAYSIVAFCRRHNFSPGLYFKLRQQGLGPTEIRIGTRVLITREAAARWRAAREAAA